MNARRVAELLRERARLDLELAEEFERESDGEERPGRSPRRERKPRALTRPSGEVSPIAAAAAERVLREKGFL